MCECGCGELRPLVKLPAPDGGWYFVEVYPGCRYCGTDWGLGVTRCTAEEAAESFWRFIVEEAPTAEFSQYGQWGAPILDTAVVLRLFMESIGETDKFAEAPFDLEEFIERGGLIDAHHQSVRGTLTTGESDG